MCGIVGYIGSGNAVAAVIEGLKRLEYRGYDSAGVAFGAPAGLAVLKTRGRVAELEAKLPPEVAAARAVGHTRWATHGAPSERNSHPHCDPSGRFAIVHNGIIDNFQKLRGELERDGARFASDTDSEVVAHLIARAYAGDLRVAVEAAVRRLEGTWALAVLAADEPERMIAARRGSPLAVGLGRDCTLLASDAVPLLPHTRRVIFLEDGELAELSAAGCRIFIDGREVAREAREISWSAEAADKGCYSHFMLKEIHEQPEALERLVRERIFLPESGAPEFNLDGVELPEEYFRGLSRIVMVAQGTAYHAAMVGRNMIERVARVPAYPEYAADFRYRDPILDPSVLVIAITQSGETMDTLHAVRLARERGCKVLAVANAVGSSIAREADAVFYLRCGPEIGVASTKAFTAMIAGLYVIALRMGQLRGTIDATELRRRAADLMGVGPRVEAALADGELIRRVVLKYKDAGHFLFLGRGTGWPLAMEGALKLKEVSYIHAEGYDAAEMKHGPIALVDENMPALFIALQGRRYEKILGNMQEIKARHGRIIAIASRDDAEIAKLADDVIRVRSDSGIMNSIVCSVPLQLLAYHIALARGCDVDKPKNLAKSVTVE